jgi:hypothetical protein
MTVTPIELKPTSKPLWTIPSEGWALLARCGHTLANKQAPSAQRRDALLGLAGAYVVIASWIVFPAMILAGAA